VPDGTSYRSDRETAILVQDHASAVVEQCRFADGEGLPVFFIEVRRSEIADGAEDPAPSSGSLWLAEEGGHDV
jgi:hypothetical protein